MKLLFVCTGGNKGIGREIISQIFQNTPSNASSVRVLMLTKNEQHGEQEASQLRDKDGKDVHMIPLQLKSEESINNVVEKVQQQIQEFGCNGLACLINNAGMAYKGNDVSPEMAQETMEVNCFGTVKLTQALIPLLQQFGQSDDAKEFAPRIIFVGSQMGKLNILSSALQEKFSAQDVTHEQIDKLLQEFIDEIKSGKHEQRGWPNNMYAVSKLGEGAHARVFARELIKDNILVHTVDPGYTQTELTNFKGDKTPAEAADGIVWLATRSIGKDKVQDETGGFWYDRKLIEW
jgi:NAD(P)-dependent dehydrogenase (short-subunit alcohol dehydrogenase family)